VLIWDDLRILLALARNPSLRAASATLNVDPTTVMRRLARLSEALDATLFERNGNHYRLTERGAELLERIERAEAAIQEGVESSDRGGLSGVIRIGAPESFATLFLAPLLHEFQSANPSVLVDLITPSWVPDPVKREVDVAILVDRPVRGALTARKLAETTLQLYATEEYLDRYPPISALDDLEGHRYIGYIRGLPQMSQALEYTIHPLPGLVSGLRTTSIAVQCNLVRKGRGIALLPYYAGTRIPGSRVICPQSVRFKQSFWLVVRQDVRQNARVTAFIKWLTDVVREHRDFFGDVSAKT